MLFQTYELWKKRIPRREGGYIFYYMPDTLVGIPFVPQILEFKDIVHIIGVFKPYYKEQFRLPAPGVWTYYDIYEAFVSWKNGQDLVFPSMSFVVSRWDYNNDFDPDVISLLRETDTLAIEQYETVFVRLDE